MQNTQLNYAGFWIRTCATIVDVILVCTFTFPILILIYGWAYFDLNETSFIAGPADFLISWVLPAICTVAFWMHRQATPGKMMFACRILDAETGAPASVGQLVGRYFAYFISFIPLGLGIVWVALDKRKQAWHDKLSGTIVVRRQKNEN